MPYFLFQPHGLQKFFHGSDLIRILVHCGFPTASHTFAIMPEQLEKEAVNIAKRQKNLIFPQRRIKHAHCPVRRKCDAPKIAEFSLLPYRPCRVAVFGIAVNSTGNDVGFHSARQVGVFLPFQPNIRQMVDSKIKCDQTACQAERTNRSSWIFHLFEGYFVTIHVFLFIRSRCPEFVNPF